MSSTSTIHPRYIAALETEPWYLLSMDAESGEYVVQIRYETAEAACGDSTDLTIASLADDQVHDEVAKGIWNAWKLAEMFEVPLVVPEHVAKLLLV